MPKNVLLGGPEFPKPPKIPQIARRSASFERHGLSLRPLAGPEVDLPPESDALLQERFLSWTAQTSGSLLEFLCYEYLRDVQKLEFNVDYLYQYPIFGGRTQFGGYVVDFFFPDRSMGWNPLGARWHTLFAPDRARDHIAKMLLAGRGIKMIYMTEPDLLTRTRFVLDKAWNGEEVGLALHPD